MEHLPQKQHSKQLATISPERLLQVYSPQNCLTHVSKLKTMQNVIESDTPSISKIGKQYGSEFQKSFLIAWVLYLNEILTLKRPLGEAQIEMVVDLIISDFPLLKISDITFIFKNAISGKYGEFYESLTIPKIISWFTDHFEQRCEVAEHLSTQQHISFNDKWDAKVIAEVFKDIPDELPKEQPKKIELPEVLEGSNGYIAMLTESVKSLSQVELKVMVDYWTKYPKYKIYLDVYQNELNSRL